MEKCTKNPFNGQKTSRESNHRPEDLMEYWFAILSSMLVLDVREPRETVSTSRKLFWHT